MDVRLLAKYKNSVEFNLRYDITDQTKLSSVSINEEFSSIKKETSATSVVFQYNGLVIGKRYKLGINILSSPTGYVSIKCGGDYKTSYQIGQIETDYFTATSQDYTLTLSSTFNGEVNEFWIEEQYYTNIDISNDLDVLLNFDIIELQNISNKSFVYSKEIALPRTSDNDTFFSYYFDTNQDNFYNFKKKIQANISYGDITFREGFLIVKEMDDYNYSALFYEDSIDIIASIGDKLLKNLDLTTHDHVNTKTNIEQANINFPTNYDYCYPFIDYGESWNGIGSYAIQKSDDRKGDGMLGHDLFPAISVKYLFDKIISEAGYTYTSTFIDLDRFKRMILPYTNDISTLDGYSGLTFQTEASFYEYQIVRTYNGLNPAYSNFSSSVINTFDGSRDFTLPNSDLKLLHLCPVRLHSLQYDLYRSYGIQTNTILANNPEYTSDGVLRSADAEIEYMYKVKKAGTYECKANLTIQSSNFDVSNGLIFYWVRIPSGTLTIYDDSTSGIPGVSTFKAFGAFDFVEAQTVTSNGTYEFSRHTFECGENDLVYLAGCIRGADTTADNPGAENYLYNITGDWRIFDMDYSQNQNVYGKDVVPKDMKQVDLLRSIFKMFNLYIRTDRNTPKNLIIEPRDIFYSGTTTKDWTYKIDNDTIKYTIPSWESPKEYYFSYQPGDSTFYNVRFERSNPNRSYGDKIDNINNDLSTNRSDITIEFQPTYVKPIAISSYFYAYDGIPVLLASRFLKGLSDTSNDYLKQIVNRDTERNPAILFYNYRYLKNSDVKNYRFYFNNTAYNYYPYAGYVLYPLDDTESVNTNYNLQFGATGNYFPFDTVCNNDLYNTYYRNQMEQIKNRNAVKLSAYLNLNADDILDLDFNEKIFIDGTYYNIIKIKDFNPGKLTYVEFLKILDIDVSYEATQTIPNQVSSIIDRPYFYSLKSSYSTKSDKSSTSFTSYEPDTRSKFDIKGDGNTITYDDVYKAPSIVVGDKNYIYTRGNVIGGSGNTMTDSTIINGFNNNLDNTNTTIIDGSNILIRLTGKTITTLGTNNQQLTLDGVYLENMVIRNGVLMLSNNVKDGGSDSVGDPFGASEVSVVCGGYNRNRGLGNPRAKNVSDGGLNKI